MDKNRLNFGLGGVLLLLGGSLSTLADGFYKSDTTRVFSGTVGVSFGLVGLIALSILRKKNQAK